MFTSRVKLFLFPVLKLKLMISQRTDLMSHSEVLKDCMFLLSAGAGTRYWHSGSLGRRTSWTGSRLLSWAITSSKHISSRYNHYLSSHASTHMHAPTQLWSGSELMNIYTLSLCSRVSVRKSGFPHLSCKACGYPTAQRAFQLHFLHSETSTLPTSRYIQSREESYLKNISTCSF